MIQKGPVSDLITMQPDYDKPYTICCLVDNHEPIIDRQLFQLVRVRLELVDQSGRPAPTENRYRTICIGRCSTLSLDHPIEEFDSDALVNVVERVVSKPGSIDVVMGYRQMAMVKIHSGKFIVGSSLFC